MLRSTVKFELLSEKSTPSEIWCAQRFWNTSATSCAAGP